MEELTGREGAPCMVQTLLGWKRGTIKELRPISGIVAVILPEGTYYCGPDRVTLV